MRSRPTSPTSRPGQKFAAKLDQPQEKEVVALGEELFYRRSGPFDFSCSTCHAAEGLRIRLQGLPYLSDPKEARKVIGEWPAYRVSTDACDDAAAPHV